MVVTRMELVKQEFFPDLFANEALEMQRLSATSWRFAAFLWRNIGDGADGDRSTWDGRAWQNHLSTPGLEFHVVYCDGEPAGCCEVLRARRLQKSLGGSARLTGFGLLPEYIGDGLAPAMLTRMAEKAFATGADRLVVSSDKPLSPTMKYICRNQGFRILESR